MRNIQNIENENKVMPQAVENMRNEQIEIAKVFGWSSMFGGTIEMTCMSFMGCCLVV